MGKERSKNIGVLTGHLETPYIREILRGMKDAAAAQKDNLLIFPGMYDQAYAGFEDDTQEENENEQYSQIFSYALSCELDVLLVSVDTIRFIEPELIGTLKRRMGNVPCLMLESSEYGEPFYTTENEHGMRECLEHLISEHHCRRIAFVGGPSGNHGACIRQQVYEQVMREHGFSVEPGDMESGDYSFYSGKQAAQRILQRGKQVDAICFANDWMALGGYEAIKEAGRLIGRDIAVTGFDDIREASCVEPPLSTVQANAYEFGFRALERAMDILAGRMFRMKAFPSRFICRASCGCTGRYVTRSSGLPQQNYEWIMRSNRLSMSMARGILQQCTQQQDLLLRVLQTIRSLQLGQVWLFLFNQPQRLEGELAEPAFWQKLRLAGSLEEQNIQVPAFAERPVLQNVPGLRHMVRGEQITYFNIFSKQGHYGIMAVAANSVENLDMLFSISIQMGTGLQHIFLEQEQSRLLQMLQEQNHRFEKQASSDALTGLYNRYGFFEEVKAQLPNHMGKPAFLAFADMDHLKEVNDLFGHSEGDEALLAVAAILQENFVGSIIGRIGGDEFVVLAFLEERESSQAILQRVEQMTEYYNKQSGKGYYVEISMGIKQFVCEECLDFSDLLKAADDHLYAAKTRRRSSCLRE